MPTLAVFRGALVAKMDAAGVACKWIFWGLWICQAHRLGLYNWLFWPYSLLAEVRNFGTPDQIPGQRHITLDFVVKGSVETITGSEVCQLLNVFKNRLTFVNIDSHEMWVCCQMKFCLLKLEIFCENRVTDGNKPALWHLWKELALLHCL